MRRILASLVLAAVGLGIAARADAKPGTAQELYEACSGVKGDGAEGQAFCLGYIRGVVDGQTTLASMIGRFLKTDFRIACVPAAATGFELKDLVVKDLSGDMSKLHPQGRDAPAVEVVTAILANHFPCPKPMNQR